MSKFPFNLANLIVNLAMLLVQLLIWFDVLPPRL